MIGVDTHQMKQHLLREVRTLIDKSGQRHPPFKPELIAPFRKVREIHSDKLQMPGMLIPVKDGFIIKLNSDDPIRRQRVTCAHEIAHTFFYDLTTSRPSKVSQRVGKWGEEGICNFLAEEMIMPEKSVHQVIAQFAYPSMKAFVTLMNQFDVSSEFITWRLHRLKIWHAIIILFAPEEFRGRRSPLAFKREASATIENDNRSSPDGQLLRVWKASKHPDYPQIRIRQGLPISPELGPAIAFRSGVDIIAREYWELGGLKGSFVVQSRRFEGRPPHVVSIFLPDDKYEDPVAGKIRQQTQLALF